MKAALAVAVAALFCACSRAPEPQPPKKSPFRSFAQHLNFEPGCDRIIPLEWSASIPVPVLVDGKPAFKVFFAGWEGHPKEPGGLKQHRAQGDAVFTAAGKIVSCEHWKGDHARPFGEVARPGMTEAQWEERMARAYDLSEKAAAAFAAGKPDPAGPAFAAALADVMDPHVAEDYRALSPEFWAWVEKSGGKAP